MRIVGIIKAKSDLDRQLTIDEAHGHETAYPDTHALKQFIEKVHLSFHMSANCRNNHNHVETSASGHHINAVAPIEIVSSP